MRAATGLAVAGLLLVAVYFYTDHKRKVVSQEILASGSQLYVSETFSPYYQGSPGVGFGQNVAVASDPLQGAPNNLFYVPLMGANG